MDQPNLPEVVPRQTSDWCICILCAKVIGLADVSHMQNPMHILRMQNDTSGVSKYIFNIPRPLYRETLRFYPDEYMPTPSELIAAYEYYSQNQPFLHGSSVSMQPPRANSPQSEINTEGMGLVNLSADFADFKAQAPKHEPECEINEELDRQLMEFVLKESAQEHNQPNQPNLKNESSSPQQPPHFADNIADEWEMDYNAGGSLDEYLDGEHESYSDISE